MSYQKTIRHTLIKANLTDPKLEYVKVRVGRHGWKSLLQWCIASLPAKEDEWIPVPTAGYFLMTKESYFLYRLHHGDSTTLHQET